MTKVLQRTMPSVIALAAGLMAASSPAMAQGAAEDATGQDVVDDGAPNDGAIVVTARKREERLQSVPVSVTAFSGEALERKGVVSFNDFAVSNPNVMISSQSAVAAVGSSVAIRGNLQGSGLIVSDPAVGIYLDGILLAHSLGTAQMSVDVAAVQTLKGPQGTLFGRNTTGGAVIVNFVQPELGDLSGYIQGDIGEVGTRRFGGAINVPIGDKIALRAVYQDNHRDDYVTYANGRATGYKEEQVARAILLVEPTETMKITGTLERTIEKGRSPTVVFTRGGDPVYENIPVSTFPTAPAAYTGGVPIDLRAEDEYAQAYAWQYRLGIEQELGEGTIKLLIGHRKYDVESFESLPPKLGWTAQDKPDNKDTSIELQYTGSLLEDRVDLAAGVYYFKETVHESQNTFFYSGLQRTSRYLEATSKSISAYAQATARITDGLNLTGGLRYTDDKKDAWLRAATSNTANLVTDTIHGTPADALANPLAFAEMSENRVNYLIGMDYTPVDDVMFYASHSTGYRSGGPGVDRQAPNAPTNPGYTQITTFLPESIKNYEVGVKSQFFDRRFTFNLAGFYQDYKDYQFIAVINAVRVTQNASAKIKGFELDASVRLGSGTHIGVDAGYTHGKVDEPGSPRDGQFLPRIPRWTFGANVSQHFDIGDDDLDFSATYSWRDDYWTVLEDTSVAAHATEPSERAWTTIKKLGLLNLTATYETGPFTFTAYATNLTNEKYHLFGVYTGGGFIDVAALGVPRVVGARGKFTF